ncbi:Hypp6533 [Branchiostoma lanceolatum]|uniref:Hypp6533 protein n=1 Tax=Branchiostoma lanceolatum TaxID=7740 RepID=A0A8J9YV74_BRALA|nr:Hypp6533 [Branchiostoma lanceolatum]
MCPEDLRVFMEKTESVTHGNRFLGEGMDAKLEEKNKASKVWHRGAPLAADWVRVFRNLDVLQKRAFATIKRLKARLRSTLTTANFNHLLRISIEGPAIDSFNFDKTVARWGSMRNRQLLV